MGSGFWDDAKYSAYTSTTYGMSAKDFSVSNHSVQEIYKSRGLVNELNPYKVMRECRDSDEHPETYPVILALDVTGSMGGASVKVAKKLNEIMTELYADSSIKDIEFCIMGIGDLAYDAAPIQISQFESDIRIAEQLDKIYFEGGGGGNKYESYSAAWYMGLYHCDLDCWKRNQKGLIITLGDELPNPHLPRELRSVTGDNCQAAVETNKLLPEVLKKFNVYHISVDDKESSYQFHRSYWNLDEDWEELLGKEHYKVATLDNLSNIIINIIKECANNYSTAVSTNEVTW